MKTNNLFPHGWKPLGWILLSICIPLGSWLLMSEESFPLSAEVTIPWSFSEGQPGLEDAFDGVSKKDGTASLQLIDELLALGVIAGLMLVGFARLRNEDERTAQMRLEALQWALYGNTAILVLCILLVHGISFINVMIYNMFTPLLIFVLRFHWLIWQESRELKRQEGGEVAL